MALVKPVIFQIVGFQNSGKTTFSVKLIKSLKAEGFKTAVIKHHGHGGKPQASNQKDSTKHLAAGADLSIVEGEGRLILQAERNDCGLEEQIKLLSFFQPEVILIEGHKQKNYPKLLLLRDQNDLLLLEKVSNIMGILYWKEEMKAQLLEQVEVPCFLIDDDASVYWAMQLIKEHVQIMMEK